MKVKQVISEKEKSELTSGISSYFRLQVNLMLVYFAIVMMSGIKGKNEENIF